MPGAGEVDVIGRGRDEERVDRRDGRAGELGRVAAVRPGPGSVDSSVAVAVTQSPVVTTTGDVDREDPFTRPMIEPVESVFTVVEPMQVSPSTPALPTTVRAC